MNSLFVFQPNEAQQQMHLLTGDQIRKSHLSCRRENGDKIMVNGTLEGEKFSEKSGMTEFQEKTKHVGYIFKANSVVLTFLGYCLFSTLFTNPGQQPVCSN